MGERGSLFKPLKISASIDGPNLCLVIRFEREGEERFARWIGGEDWRDRDALHRLFADTERRRR